MAALQLSSIEPTVFLRAGAAGPEQLVRVELGAAGVSPFEAEVTVVGVGPVRAAGVAVAGAGPVVVEVFVPEVQAPCDLTFLLSSGGTVVDSRTVAWQPPRHWTVHVVQLSHHDVGYTDLASHVIPEHDRWLDRLIEFAAGTADRPDEAHFRAVVEQAWSIDHFVKTAPAERAARMLELIRCGDVEVTALFGNLTTELCDHETLVRALYPAARLAREHGFRIVSAEHNDIPGFTWGLCEVLAGADIEIFCPGLPLYYSWGANGLPSFWDEKAIFGARGIPGAFWWESPSGKRLLFWCNNQGCGGGHDPDLPGLGKRLAELERDGYACDVLRWPVKGAARDNSLYIPDYCDTIRRWNAAWAFPRLVSSTNARFWRDLRPSLPGNLPVWRGGVPGQDYPVGAMSTSRATVVCRRTQAELPAAERLAAAASLLTDYAYQGQRIAVAYRHILWHCEHTWGHHFPCGPTAEAAELEKAVHAHRAAALSYDVRRKAAARVADRVRLQHDGIHLVVFNPTPQPRTDRLRHPLREIDNCGSELVPQLAGDGAGRSRHLKPVILTDRWPVHPPPELVAGRFRLVDVDSGEPVPFQVVPVSDTLDDTPHAAQRTGLGAGGQRYGFFEDPSGLACNLCFVAHNVPAMGWRTYCLEPLDAAPAATRFPASPCSPASGASHASCPAVPHLIENEFYRIELDLQTGLIAEITDKSLGVNLVDRQAPHPFGGLLVTAADGTQSLARLVCFHEVANGRVLSRLRVEFAAEGHPRILLTINLWQGLRLVEMAVHVLKAPNPLLDANLAFPFDVAGGRYTVDDSFSASDPATDRLPGAFLNRLSVRDWVRTGNDRLAVLWSSLDSPIVSLGRLWPSRVSPAHSCVVGERCRERPQSAADLAGGAIYSTLFANNFGTNFAVSQTAAVLFRYVLSSGPADESSAALASRFGEMARHPFHAVFTKHPGGRDLPPAGEFLSVEGEGIRLLAVKQAEEGGDGLVLRLWNSDTTACTARVRIPAVAMARMERVGLTEGGQAVPVQRDGHTWEVIVAPREVVTLRAFPAGPAAAFQQRPCLR